MPRFLAPQPQPKKTPSTSQDRSIGALNSGSEPADSRTLESRSGVSLAAPPAHPLSSRTIPRPSTIRIDEPPHRENTNEDAQAYAKTDGEGENQSEDRQTGGEEDHSRETMEDSAEEELTEEQLRKLFEDEEIERFLRHFNAHVQEVRLPTTRAPVAVGLAAGPPYAVAVTDDTKGIILSPNAEDPPTPVLNPGSGEEREGVEDSAWTMFDRSYLRSAVDTDDGKALLQTSPKNSFSLSEKIAKKYILPNLPPLQPSQDYRFTIGRARLQAERFNLVMQPAYGPFFARMWGYASWKSPGASAFYCTIFWVLWFLDFLLPTLFAVILYTLFRRRIFSYPTLEELRDRRREAARAEALGEQVEKRFATGPDFGMRDAWKLFRSVTKGKKKDQTKKGKSSKADAASEEEHTSHVQLDATEGDESVAKIEVQGESQAEKDTKRAILQAMGEIADLHERIKNVFLWRRPQVSRNYAMAITFLFLVTLLLPTRYLAKLTYFVGGFFFWFVPPVILGLPPADRSRIPPAFADSPTDAQYAMEMISLRVARGESVVPANVKSSKKKKATSASTHDPSSETQEEKEEKDKEVDWRKWGERAARGFSWAEEGRRVFKGDMPLRQGTWPLNPLVPYIALAHGQPNAEIETSTYPAQHTTSPGLLTLTSTTLSFTQVLSSKPKVQIRLDHIRGVKKAGKMGGLIVKWGETEEDGREEIFRWVGGRDEVFAKLVGWGGRRWVHV